MKACDLLGVVGPVLADVLVLLLEQVDGGVELLLVQRVGVLDARARAGSSSGTARRRRCRSGESYAVTLPSYVEAPSNTAPHDVGAGLTYSVLYISRLAPQPCGMPYICAVDACSSPAP